MVSITLKSLTKRFGDVTAVADLSLTIKKGELFFLLGPSGCGKTTVLRTIAGFCQPDAGEVLFDERPVTNVPPQRRNTAMVFQNYALWPHMTVRQNVEYGLASRGVSRAERRKRADEALSIVRMNGYGDRFPSELSGGQQQRVAVARALVVEPDVVLLDEPLSNLDAKLRLDMRDEIRRIHQQVGTTMVYVTHDQKEALSMAQRLVVMNEGRAIQQGTPWEVYSRPANTFVAAFMGEANFLEGRVENVDGNQATVSTALGNLKVAHGATPLSKGQTVLCSARPEHISLTESKAPNCLSAEVKGVTYLGETEQALLDVGGQQMKMLRLAPLSTPLSEGERVTISIPPESLMLFPKE